MLLDLLSVKAWAMEAGYFERAYPIALDMISRGHGLSRLAGMEKKAAVFPQGGMADANTGIPVFKASNGLKVGIMQIMGGLTKSGGLCSFGTADYIKFIAAANASDGIDALVLEIDSPGGSVDGTQELGLAIKESAKPIVAFADNQVASAGYWIASQARAIVANANNPTKIGSIGTLFVLPNYAHVIKAGNLPNVRIMRAPQSTDKALINPFEEITAAQESALLADLEDITNMFIDTVRAGRNGRLSTGKENIFTGKMYTAQKALDLGMIDQVGTRQDALDMAGELAQQSKKTGPAVSGNTNKSNMEFSKISSLFGKAKTEETTELSADDQATLMAAEQKLTEKDTLIASLQGQLNEAAALAKKHAATIEAMQAEADERLEVIEELEAKLAEAPAGAATTAIHAADEFKDGKETFQTSVDAELAGYEKEFSLQKNQ